MNEFQKVIKYCAVAFAIFLAVTIIGAIITAVLGVFGGFFFIDKLFSNSNTEISSNNVTSYTKEFENISSLNVNSGISKLYIKQGNTLKVEASNLNNTFSCDDNNGTLTINYVSDKKIFDFSNSNASITIYIPENLKLESAKIDSGIGNVNIDYLNTSNININSGISEFNGKNIKADNTKINLGTGSANFDNVSFNNLDLDSGVGKTVINGKITGNININAGVGKIEFNIDGKRQDYTVSSVKKGIGSISIDGINLDDGSADKSNSSNTITIDGGIGETRLNFTNK